MWLIYSGGMWSDDKYYPVRESISNNKQFGRDGSKFFNNQEQAETYFHRLNLSLEAAEQCEITVEDLRESDFEVRNIINCDEIVPGNILLKNTLHEKGKGIFRLRETFTKNGYDYHLHERSDNVVPIRAMHGDTIAFYEVCMIKVLPAETILGKYYPQREALPSDAEFGNEGNKSFFGNDYDSAISYFKEQSTLARV